MKRFIKLPLFSLFFSALLWPLAGNQTCAQSPSEQGDAESFMIIAGTNITEDGSVLVAHNHEQDDKETYYLQQHPRTPHDSGEVVTFPNGLEIKQTNITAGWLGLENDKDCKSSGAVGINEHQVAIGGWVSLESDLNEKARQANPFVKRGVTQGMLPVVLQRARSAREFVTVLGDFFNRYGIASGLGIAVADKKEAWYIETAGGRHWAAIQIPPDACWVQAGNYRIGHIDPNDDEVMASPGLQDFAADHSLYDPQEELFHFADAFGSHLQDSTSGVHSTSGRLWRGISLLDPSLDMKPGQEEFPRFIRPEEKVTFQQLISILRDQYQGTPYYVFGSDSTANGGKAIASRNTVYSSIVQLTNGLPANVGAVLWASLGRPNTAPFIPFYFGINEVPKPYGRQVPKPQKAYSVFSRLSESYYADPGKYTSVFPGVWDKFESRAIKEQVEIDQGAMRLYRNGTRMAKHFITVNVEGLGQQALDMAEKQLEEMEALEE